MYGRIEGRGWKLDWSGLEEEHETYQLPRNFRLQDVLLRLLCIFVAEWEFWLVIGWLSLRCNGWMGWDGEDLYIHSLVYLGSHVRTSTVAGTSSKMSTFRTQDFRRILRGLGGWVLKMGPRLFCCVGYKHMKVWSYVVVCCRVRNRRGHAARRGLDKEKQLRTVRGRIILDITRRIKVSVKCRCSLVEEELLWGLECDSNVWCEVTNIACQLYFSLG